MATLAVVAYGDPQPTAPIVSGIPSGGGVPPRMSLDAVACLSGVTTAQLAGLNGPFDGAVVVTTGASTNGDGLGKAWVWVEGDTTAANGTTVLGSGAYGRWRDATALAGGGSSAGTSITIAPGAGQITDAGTVTASNVQLAITAARVFTGLLAATGGQLTKVLTNTSAFDATFNHQDAAATAANRVITSSGTPFVLAAGKSATFAYDTTAQRWRIAGQDALRASQADRADALGGLLTTDLDTFVPGAAGVVVDTVAYSDATTDFGFDEPGDMGRARWRWYAGSTATRNGYTVFGTTSAGRWRMLPQSVYLITQFGGRPGTSVDNGAILSGAWEALRPRRRGKIMIHVPASCNPTTGQPYHCTTRPVVPTADGRTKVYGVTGDGWECGSRELFGYDYMADVNHKPTGSVLYFATNVSGPGWLDGQTSNFEARDIAFAGSPQSTTKTIGFQSGLGQTTLDNVLFISFWVAADLGQSVSSRTLRRVWARSCWQGVITGEAENRFTEIEAQACNYGVVVQNGYDIHASKLLLQGNLCHVLLGENSGDSGRSFTFDKVHYESVDAPQFFLAVQAMETSTNRTLSGVQNIDGVTGADSQPVWLAAQTNPIENGAWLMSTGAWVRIPYTGRNYLNAVCRGLYVRVTGGNAARVGLWKIDDFAGPGFAGRDVLTMTRINTDPNGTGLSVRVRTGLSYVYNLNLLNSDSSESGTIQLPGSPSSTHIENLYGGAMTVDIPATDSSGFGVSFARSNVSFVVRNDANIRGTYFDGREVRQDRRVDIVGSATSFTPDVNQGSHYISRSLNANLTVNEPQGFGYHSIVSFLFVMGSSTGSASVNFTTFSAQVPVTRAPAAATRYVAFYKVQTGYWACIQDTGWVYGSAFRLSAPLSGGTTLTQWDHFYKYDWPLIEWNSSSAGTITIPANATQYLPVGQTMRIACLGTGQLTVAHALGAGSLRTFGPGLKSAGQYGEIRLRQAAADIWHVQGDLAA